MSNICGSGWIGMIVDGDSAQGSIRATAPLSQSYQKDTNLCMPDWTVAANQPIIYPMMRSGNENTVKAIVAGTEKFYYNDQLIVFNASGVSTSPANVAGKFQTTTYNNGVVVVPALRVIGNLATAANMDADRIRMDGEIEASGHNLAFTSELIIAISEFSNSAYYGYLTASNGGVVDSNNLTCAITQKLYKAGGEIPQSAYTVKWYKMPSTTAASSANSYSVGEADIDSKLTVRCSFLIDNVEVATAFVEVSDETDPLFVDVVLTGPKLLSATGVNSTVTAAYKVKKVGTGEEVTGFSFVTAFTNAAGATFTPTSVQPTSGFLLTYAEVKAASGNISYYITGSKS